MLAVAAYLGADYGRRLHGRRGLKSRVYESLRRDYASPPSRAAWIEIGESGEFGRNTASPPSRAAWIEIQPLMQAQPPSDVAAFTGGVD